MRIFFLLTFLSLFTSKNFYGQSSLPLTRTIWSGKTPSGWIDAGTGSYQSSFACSDGDMGKLNTEGDYYLISFAGQPDKLFFELKNATLNPLCELRVQVSNDGRGYETLKTYKAQDFQDCEEIIHGLNSNTRFVKFIYSKKVKNGSFGLDDVKISMKKSNSGGGGGDSPSRY